MRTLLLTGATGDIGHAIAEKYKKKGEIVIAPTRAECDLSIPESVDRYLTTISSTIDVFIHCAGFNEPKKIEDIQYNDLLKTHQINAFAFYQIVNFLTKNKKIAEGGHILGISSIYGQISRPARFSYASSKHSLNGMVKTLAIELGPLNIKVNSISPGFVDTKLTRKNNSPEKIREFEKKIPLGRLVSVDDVANIVYFFASPENTFVTGQDIIIDGGYTIGGFEV